MSHSGIGVRIEVEMTDGDGGGEGRGRGTGRGEEDRDKERSLEMREKQCCSNLFSYSAILGFFPKPKLQDLLFHWEYKTGSF